MSESLLVEILFGLYLGLMAALFPALIAFAMGFVFKYVTDVSVPAFAVVVLGGALAGISGGLLGLVDSEIANDWTGITAILVILMASLWAHSVGDSLAEATPRRLTLESLRSASLSADVLDRVDSVGRVRVTVHGEVGDLEGYPPLPEHVREAIRADSWKLPADRSLGELESILATRLGESYDLADVSVTIDDEGNATVAAAPAAAGLSRRVPQGLRAVSIETLLPTGIARGDTVSISLPDGTVSGPVLSARTDETDASAASGGSPDGESSEGDPVPPEGERLAPAEDAEPGSRGGKRTLRSAPTTTGGDGRVTIACTGEEARRVLQRDRAPMAVRAHGTAAEYEAIGLLKRGGNQFARVTVGDDSPLDGASLELAEVRERFGVVVLAIRRASDVVPVPRGDATVAGGDRLLVVGSRSKLRAFEEAVA